ncbi:hypothetical protein Pfo_000452 [Paulownia fortunei]|nr:hypothetical protein Pfo_000452 [Paulownia fortunei]
MEKKRGRLPKVNKIRGRPKKIKVEKEEGLESNSSDGVGNASSPGPASASLDTPLVSRCQTQYAKELADKEDALNTPSRFPFQNDDGNTSKNSSTLLLVKQILFDAK